MEVDHVGSETGFDGGGINVGYFQPSALGILQYVDIASDLITARPLAEQAEGIPSGANIVIN